MAPGTMSEADVLRLTRLKDRSIIKREGYLAWFRTIYGLAKRSVEDDDAASQLSVAIADVDELRQAFILEDDAVLDHSLALEKPSEYSNALLLEVREIIIHAKAAVHRICAQKRTFQGVKNMDHDGHPYAVDLFDVRSPGASNNVPPTISERSPAIRLPEIPLPSFSGDIFQWSSFRDRFVALVDQRPLLSNIDKNHYLVGCLRGNALDSIRGIPLSGDTYHLLWSTLEARYNKPRLVAGSVVETLLNTPVASTESLSDLNKFSVAFDESVSILDSLQIPDLGDFILFSLASRCLPLSLRTLFESQGENGYPTVRNLLSFVKTRITVLDRAQDTRLVPKGNQSGRSSDNLRIEPRGSRKFGKVSPTSFLAADVSAGPVPCKCCSGGHSLTSCQKFKGWSLDRRSNWSREQKLCFRCLNEGHWSPRCRSSIVCSICSRKHHTLVHKDATVALDSGDKHVVPNQPTATSLSSVVNPSNSYSVLLGTALVHIRDVSGVLHTVRALVDSASQISAITMACSRRLGLKTTRWTAPVSGLSGASVSSVQGIVNCQVQPRFSEEPVLPFTAWVFPSITGFMPRQPLPKDIANRYKHLALADPAFTSPAEVDLLLGADIFAQILDGKRVAVDSAYPVAFGSVFGWIIIGPVPPSDVHAPQSCPISLTTSLESLMDQFWSIEEPDAAPAEFTDNGLCEKIFLEGYSRVESGRFSVPLPFRQLITDDQFRGSRSVAVKRFEHLERKLATNPRLRDLYCDFMSEYIKLGHMSRATSVGKYFIPHHAIYRVDDDAPKIRVVFDASARSSSGESLNSSLLAGPKLQRDVVDVLLLFRLRRYAFTTDICKMYRQILINPEFRTYQHVLWRESPQERLEAYELNTVTYGVNCAPYLALKVLQLIAEKDCNGIPLVRQALTYQTYVDDICVGADTEEQAVELQISLINVLLQAGLQLKKWSSNTPAVLNSVPPEDRVDGSLNFEDGDGTKVLGLQWNNRDDAFGYQFKSDKFIATKRGMLSLIARIFDPLGILAPSVFLAKHFMQRVWQLDLSWDDPLPSSIADLWRLFVSELPTLQQLSIPRFVGGRQGARAILCGFCDASERGYAAVIYVRIEHATNPLMISLLGSKTKLAPMKETTIPRLELCGALLLARWLARIQRALSADLEIINVFAWTDSTIVLNWLQVRHESFKIFVSNRIHQIHSLIPDCHWNHIMSVNNPADCVSRGLFPSELVAHTLYWKGPALLELPMTDWDVDFVPLPANQLPDFKNLEPAVLLVKEDCEWFSRFSSLVQLIRVVARMRRFVSSCRRQPVVHCYLTRQELDEATLSVVRASQTVFFGAVYKEIRGVRPLSDRLIARLCPFIDDQGLIRVGGRLSHAVMSQDQKHPILLSKGSHLALLIVRHWHDITGHSGPGVMSTLIVRRYWILSLRTLIRTVISRCTVCVRFSATNPQPIMADLPRARVTESCPFSRVGIDFAGPFMMTEHRLRNSRKYKVYVAVFICFVVKAIHLEVVSDLSTSAFLAALKRFVARRGLPTDIYTDCGTNFVGAARQLQELVNNPEHRDIISASLQSTWHFNPPSAPHFGGLWEAAVRSTKTLMVKIMGEHVFTLEEFFTIVYRIESILNSRLLTPASTDPRETECLTPGHFLIGRPLVAVPEEQISDSPRHLTNRWTLLNQCVQSFWRRWRNEYLQSLQIRTRWTKDTPNLDVNDVVIIKEPNTPPLKWHLARVEETFPGADGVVRVVRLRTSEGHLTRPVVKVVKLPTD